ncbi:hypothetical protein M9458_027509 [Cirrhinus mrigala]|uniref:G-protein coupled receptors family 1 profile domain-containing protein n=1 Tax=Cirrhinus mrigala TaxID=683832 RepID=A0ABD0PY38_CIRMR
MEEYDYHFDNYTEAEYYDIIEPCSKARSQNIENVLQLFVYPVICFVGLIGNALVTVMYALYKRTKSMTDVCLLHVAIADILFAVALPLIIYSEQHEWSMGNWSCKLLRGIYSVNLYSGMLLLACISGGQYLSIVHARRSSAPLYSHLVCAAAWLLALLLSVPTFVFHERYQTESSYFNITDSEDVPYVCFFKFQSDVITAVPRFQLALGFILPLLITGFCYSSITVTLLQDKNFQRHKAVHVVLTVVLVFVVCHMPYNITLLYYITNMFQEQECSDFESAELAVIITRSLAYLHACLNPLLYALIRVNFRKHGKNYVSARWSSCSTSEISISMRRSTSDNGTLFIM